MTFARIPSRWRTVRADVVVALLVLVGALAILGRSAELTPFDGDEGHYVSTAFYFELFAVHRDFSAPEWGDNYATHTQPMLTRMIVGGWLWARGYDLKTLPQEYRWQKSFKENVRQGRVIEGALLKDARTPMVALGAGAIVLLYCIGRLLAGPIAGLIAAGLALASPLIREYFVRALPEPSLSFFILLALLPGLLATRRVGGGHLPVSWALALGATLGLAVQAKLTALLSAFAVLAWAGLVCVERARGRRPGQRPLGLRLMASSARSWLLALLVMLVVFALTNPHLYPDPVHHASHLLTQRSADFAMHQHSMQKSALYGFNDRVSYVLHGSLIRYTATGSAGLPIEAALAAVGLGMLLVRTWRGWWREGRPTVEALVLVTLVMYVLGISLTIGISWRRYVVPTLLFATLLSGIGSAAILDGLSARLLGLAAEPFQRLLPLPIRVPALDVMRSHGNRAAPRR